MRPLGGLFFGWLAKKTSSKKSLAVSMVLMALATSITGALPTYSMVGSWATALIAIARALQGFSAGGQLIGAYIVSLDACQRRYRGLSSGLIMGGALVGMVIAALLVEVIRASVSTEDMVTYGWRIPFFFSLLVTPISYYLESMTEEEASHEGQVEMEEEEKMGWRHFIVQYAGGLWVNFWATVTWTAFMYGLSVWLLAFESSELGPFNVKAEYIYNIAVELLLGCVLVLFGWVSDKWGYTKVFTIGVAWLALTIIPLVYGLSFGSRLGVGILMLQILWAIPTGMVGSVLGTIAVSCYPRPIRFIGMGFSFNLAQCIFGGPTPLILSALSSDSMPRLAVAYFLCAVGVVAGVFTSLGFYCARYRIENHDQELLPREIKWLVNNNRMQPASTSAISESTPLALDTVEPGSIELQALGDSNVVAATEKL